MTTTITKTTGAAVGCCGAFKTFLNRGNVLELAIGLILGVAFGAIVKSMVSDILMPVVSLAGESNLANQFFILRNGTVDSNLLHTVDQAQKAGAITLNYGRFADAVVNFFMLALFLFMIIQLVACFHRKEEEASTDFACPKCAETCKEAAVKCPHCGTEPIAAPTAVTQ